MKSLNTVSLRERIALCEDFSLEERLMLLDAVHVLLPPDVELHSENNVLERIENVWLAISTDETGEGVCGAPLEGTMMPLMAFDQTRLDTYVRPVARQFPSLFGKQVIIAKFSTREDLEIFKP